MLSLSSHPVSLGSLQHFWWKVAPGHPWVRRLMLNRQRQQLAKHTFCCGFMSVLPNNSESLSPAALSPCPEEFAQVCVWWWEGAKDKWLLGFIWSVLEIWTAVLALVLPENNPQRRQTATRIQTFTSHVVWNMFCFGRQILILILDISFFWSHVGKIPPATFMDQICATTLQWHEG